MPVYSKHVQVTTLIYGYQKEDGDVWEWCQRRDYEDSFTCPQNLHVQNSYGMLRSPHTKQSHEFCAASWLRSWLFVAFGAVFGIGGLPALGRVEIARTRGGLLEEHISHVTLWGWFSYVQVAHVHSINSCSGSDTWPAGAVGRETVVTGGDAEGSRGLAMTADSDGDVADMLVRPRPSA